MLIITTSTVLLLIFPCFYLLQLHSLAWTALALGIVTLLSSLDQGNTVTAVVENCPENVRYSGVAFTYNLGNALFGGTTPLIATLLIENVGLTAPSYYLFFMAVISLITALTLLKDNQSMKSVLLVTRDKPIKQLSS
jgi:MHS family proline/betaine transporter-like MFS transporter